MVHFILRPEFSATTDLTFDLYDFSCCFVVVIVVIVVAVFFAFFRNSER